MTHSMTAPNRAAPPVAGAKARRAAGPIAALINPLSFRMSLRDRTRRTEDWVLRHGGLPFKATSLDEIHAALARSLEAGCRCIILAGGDGTLQAAATWLHEHCPAEDLPELIVLGAGRTNYVAADLGTRRDFLATLEKILHSDPAQLHPVLRHAMVFEHPDLGRQCGFFAAGAVVDQIIRDVHAWRSAHPGWQRNHHAASAVGVARILFRRLRGRHRFELRRIAVEADGLGRLHAPCRLLLLTSLHLHRTLADPYAERGSGALRMMAVDADATRFWPRVARLATGRYSTQMNPENGYLSGNCDHIRIENLDQITIDGEEFTLNPAQPLTVRTGPRFRFLRP